MENDELLAFTSQRLGSMRDPETALSEPNGIAISEELAKMHFGEDWRNSALGETFLVNHAHSLWRYENDGCV